jgi:hypothetical protein
MARKNSQRYLTYDQDYAPNARGFKNNPDRNLKFLIKNMYKRHLTELAMNRFKWSGLPDEIDSRFLELELFRHALVTFYEETDPEFIRKFGRRFFATAASPMGGLNVYENPIRFRTYGTHYQAKTLASNACVPIWANMLRTPDADIVDVYAEQLTEMTITIQANSKLLRKQKFIYANQNTRLSYANLHRQMEEGAEVIYGEEDAMNPSNIQVLDLGGDPVGVLNLMIAKSKLWNECMTMLGINNANQDKKERLVADEVAANDDQVFATRGIALNARQYACEQINRKYKDKDGVPLEVSVEFNTDAEAQGSLDPSITAMPGLTEMGAGQ